MLCILFLAGCNLPPVLTPVPALPTATSPQPAATATPSTDAHVCASDRHNRPAPTPTDLPELPENAATVQIVFCRGGIFYLTYDVSLWEAVPVAEEPGAYRLVSLVFLAVKCTSSLGTGWTPTSISPTSPPR